MLKRDEETDDVGPHRGVPQGRQPHVFLYRGLLSLEELLPGIRADLLARGAVAIDTGNLAWLGEQGWMATGLRGQAPQGLRTRGGTAVVDRDERGPAVRDQRRPADGDARAQSVLGRVYHLMGSPMLLFDPILIASATRARVRWLGPPVPRPRSLDSLGGPPTTT